MRFTMYCLLMIIAVITTSSVAAQTRYHKINIPALADTSLHMTCDCFPDFLNDGPVPDPTDELDMLTYAWNPGQGVEGDGPYEIVFSPDESKIFVNCSISDNVYIYDSENLNRLAVINVGGDPRTMAINEDYLFVACRGSNEIIVIDWRTHSIVTSLPTADKPTYLELTPDQSRIAVCCDIAAEYPCQFFDTQSFNLVDTVQPVIYSQRYSGYSYLESFASVKRYDGVGFSADGSTLVNWGGGQLWFYSMEDNHDRETIDFGYAITSARLSDDRSTLICKVYMNDEQWTFYRIDMNSRTVIDSLTFDPEAYSQAQGITVNETGTRALVSYTEHIALLDFENSEVDLRLSTMINWIGRENNIPYAIIGNSHRMELYEFETGSRITDFALAANDDVDYQYCSLSPSGNKAAFISIMIEEKIHLVDLSDPENPEYVAGVTFGDEPDADKPRYMDLDISNDLLVICNLQSANLSVLNSNTGFVEFVIPDGAYLHDVDISPDGHYAYVARHNGVEPALSIMDLQTGEMNLIEDSPYGSFDVLALTDGDHVAIGGAGNGIVVYEVDGLNAVRIADIPCQFTTWIPSMYSSEVFLTTDGQYLLANDVLEREILVISTESWDVLSHLPVPSTVREIAFGRPDGWSFDAAIATCPHSGNRVLMRIYGENSEVISTINDLPYCFQAVYRPSRNQFAVSFGTNKLAHIDVETGEIVDSTNTIYLNYAWDMLVTENDELIMLYAVDHLEDYNRRGFLYLPDSEELLRIEGIPTDMEYDPDTRTVFLSVTEFDQILAVRLDESGGIAEYGPLGLPGPGMTLLPSYPNPFNGQTTVRFHVQTPGMVRLSVYNILGQKICDLANEEVMPGIYSIPWNAENLPSGQYFLRFDAQDHAETRRITLIR